MAQCEMHPLLNAYHDGELSAVQAREVAAHVAGCAQCADALLEMTAVSRLLSGLKDDPEVTPAQLASMHRAFDDAVDSSLARPSRSFWRTAALISGLAASVLIVATTWLLETPGPTPSVTTPVVASAPWETVALNLRADPLPYSGPASFETTTAFAQADTQMADWMIENLNRKGRP